MGNSARKAIESLSLSPAHMATLNALLQPTNQYPAGHDNFFRRFLFQVLEKGCTNEGWEPVSALIHAPLENIEVSIEQDSSVVIRGPKSSVTLHFEMPKAKSKPQLHHQLHADFYFHADLQSEIESYRAKCGVISFKRFSGLLDQLKATDDRKLDERITDLKELLNN